MISHRRRRVIERMLLNQGEQFHKNQEHDKVAIVMTQAISLLDSRTPTTEHAQFYQNRAGAYAALGRPMEARRDATTALELNPRESDVHGLLCAVCNELKLGKEVFMNAIKKIGLDGDEDMRLMFLLGSTMADLPDLPVEDIVKALNPSLSLWKKLIEALFENRAWSLLAHFFSLPLEKQGGLRGYTADDLQLWRLVGLTGSSDMITYELFPILLDRGAKPESLVPSFINPLCKMLITGRPVSFAFIHAMLRTPLFLDCLLDLGEERKEPNYPDEGNLLHRMIRIYRRLDTTGRRLKFICELSTRTSRSLPERHDGALLQEEKLILDLNDSETAIYNACNAILSHYNRT